MIETKILQFFANKNVLITGGTGLIGRQVVDILADAGAKVRVVSLDDLIVNDKADYEVADLCYFENCLKFTKNMDAVFHIAGVPASVTSTKEKPASHFTTTIMMNANVLEACRLNKVEKVICTSSIGAYAHADILRESDDPGVPMDYFPGYAKRMEELQIKAYKIEYGINFSVVRLAHVYGLGDNFDSDHSLVIPSILHRIYQKHDPVIVWGDGTAIRDFVYSEDIAEGIILALYHGTDADFINLGSGRGYSIIELVETLHEFIDFNHKFDTSKPSGYAKRIMDISLATEKLGYSPTTNLRDGLQKTWQWLVEQG